MKFISIYILVLAAVLGAESANAQQEIVMEETSDQGTFLVSIEWEPNDIGRDNTFSITFIESVTGTVMEDIRYDFRVVQGEGGEQILRRVDQVSSEQRFSFGETGPHTILIEDIEGLGENASFTFQVTPEFPAIFGIAAGVAAAIGVAVTRLTGTNLFRSRDQ